MLTTTLTTRFDLRHPIIQAGMASQSGAELASAVSNAGALGSIGSIARSPDNFRAEVRRCRELTARPFAANIVTFPWAPFADEMVTVAIEERVPVATVSFGDPLPALKRLQDANIPTVVQVQDFPGAKAALAAGPDALIVQGNEAGGHTGGRGTLAFAAQVLEIAGDVPVLIAGGVGNGRGLAAALAMGAAGVLMGTRFKATFEFGPSMPHATEQKSAIVASDGENTLWDPVFDSAVGMVWPNGVVGRAFRSPFSEEWQSRSSTLRETVRQAPDRRAFAMELEKSPSTVINWAGESSGLVHEILPAAEVVERTVHEAEDLLRAAAKVLQ